MSSKGSIVGGLFEADTPRASLDQRQLWLIIAGALALLCLAWALTESAGLQWIIVIAALLFWNYLLVRAGAGEPSSETQSEMPKRNLVVPFVAAFALLGLATVLASAADEWSLYPGREAIRFALVGAPIMVWTNHYYESRRAEEQALDS